MNDNTVIIKDLKNILADQLKNNLADVILFGSQISSQASKDSDFDILILLKEKANWKIQRLISDLCYEIDLKYGIITDTHVLGIDELNMPRGRQPIFINAIKNGYHA